MVRVCLKISQTDVKCCRNVWLFSPEASNRMWISISGVENKQEIEKIRKTFNQALYGHVKEKVLCLFTPLLSTVFLLLFFSFTPQENKDCLCPVLNLRPC